MVERTTKADLVESESMHLGRVSPLDRLKVPQALDGREGKFRLPRDQCKIEAETDLEAVILWLSQYGLGSSTYLSYRRVIETLINWSLIERKKPISSLTPDDFLALNKFLAEPQPDCRWISRKHTARCDDNWTPLVGPLSPKSRIHAIATSTSLFAWLRKVGYCDVRVENWRNRDQTLGDSFQLTQTVVNDPTPNVIGIVEWDLLREFLQQSGPGKTQLRTRLVIELMYYGGISLREIVDARASDLSKSGSCMLLTLRSRSAHLAQVYLVPPLMQTVECWFAATGRPPPGQHGDSGSSIQDSAPIFHVSIETLQSCVMNVLAIVSDHAESDGNFSSAARLMNLKPRHFRHAFEVHATAVGQSRSIWLLLGASKLIAPATRQYLRRGEKLTEEELERAFSSLSGFWSYKPDQSPDGQG